MKTSQFFVIFFILYILESRITSSAGIDALENYQLGFQFCPIPKTGSTITHTMLCDIHREYRGIFFERKYSSDLGGDNDCKLNDWYPEHHKAFWAKRKVSLKFTIVRDPIDRFVSLYGSACDQLKMCKDRDIHEFAHWVNNMRKQRGAAARKIRDGEGHELYRWIFYHALPQTSFCNLVADRERFTIIRYSTDKQAMYADFQKLFSRAGIPERVSERALLHLSKSNTWHASSNSSRADELKEAILQNATTNQLIRNIYQADYQYLGFE